jgi:hypothetical protein
LPERGVARVPNQVGEHRLSDADRSGDEEKLDRTAEPILARRHLDYVYFKGSARPRAGSAHRVVGKRLKRTRPGVSCLASEFGFDLHRTH